jgi:hypothetical protein
MFQTVKMKKTACAKDSSIKANHADCFAIDHFSLNLIAAFSTSTSVGVKNLTENQRVNTIA